MLFSKEQIYCSCDNTIWYLHIKNWFANKSIFANNFFIQEAKEQLSPLSAALEKLQQEKQELMEHKRKKQEEGQEKVDAYSCSHLSHLQTFGVCLQHVMYKADSKLLSLTFFSAFSNAVMSPVSVFLLSLKTWWCTI